MIQATLETIESYIFLPFEDFLSNHYILQYIFQALAVIWALTWVLPILIILYKRLTRRTQNLKEKYGN